MTEEIWSHSENLPKLKEAVEKAQAALAAKKMGVWEIQGLEISTEGTVQAKLAKKGAPKGRFIVFFLRKNAFRASFNLQGIPSSRTEKLVSILVKTLPPLPRPDLTEEEYQLRQLRRNMSPTELRSSLKAAFMKRVRALFREDEMPEETELETSIRLTMPDLANELLKDSDFSESVKACALQEAIDSIARNFDEVRI